MVGKRGSAMRTADRRTAGFGLIAAAMSLAAALPLAGCFTQTYTHGYVVQEGALEQVPLGATQEQVLIVLGTPSTVATVNGEAFYYISERAEKTAFLPQRGVKGRVVLVNSRAPEKTRVPAATRGEPSGHRRLFRQEPPCPAPGRLRTAGR